MLSNTKAVLLVSLKGYQIKHAAAERKIETMITFKTANQKLEQFLFVHDIRFISFEKNSDGLTEWTYDISAELERVVAEYREIDSRRQARRKTESMS